MRKSPYIYFTASKVLGEIHLTLFFILTKIIRAQIILVPMEYGLLDDMSCNNFEKHYCFELQQERISLFENFDQYQH